MFLHLRLKMKLIKFVQYRPLNTSKWGNKKNLFPFLWSSIIISFYFAPNKTYAAIRTPINHCSCTQMTILVGVFFHLQFHNERIKNIVPFHVKLLFPSIYCPELTMCVTRQLKRLADHRTRNCSNFYSI